MLRLLRFPTFTSLANEKLDQVGGLDMTDSRNYKLLISLTVIVILTLALSWGASSNDYALESVLLRKDYPFIDLYFSANDEFLIIDCRNIYSQEEQYWIVNVPGEYEFYKEYFAVDTFPVGRGTTPTNLLFVFKNKHLHRLIPYERVYIEHVIWEKAFSQVEKEMVWGFVRDWIV